MADQFSPQDLMDLNEIRMRLPDGDPRIEKISSILGPVSRPTASMSAQPNSVSNWLQNLEGDIRQGGGETLPGRILQFLGAPGLERGMPESVANTAGGPLIGPVTTAQGVNAMRTDPWQGLMRTLEGVGQTTFPLSLSVGAPKAGELAGKATQAASHYLPGATKSAGRLFQEVMQAAKDVTVDVSKPGEVALRISQLVDRGSQMPQVVSKFLRRVTDPAKGEITYQEARDFYSNISKLSGDETKRLSPIVRGQMKQLRAAMNNAITEAAGKVQKGQEYVEAMANYRGAARAQQVTKNVLKYGIPYTGAGYTLYDIFRKSTK